MSGIYTVSPYTDKVYNIIDAEKGTIVNRIVIHDGIVSTGPIVVGDRCTFVVNTGNNQQVGYIYSLPKGTVINRFVT
jgi:hypothetical protein